MTEKNEGKQLIGIRLEDEEKKQIDQLVTEGEYESISAFVRIAIKDKLNPKLRKARLRKEVMDVLADPDVRRDLGIK